MKRDINFIKHIKPQLKEKERTDKEVSRQTQFGHDASKKTCLWLKGLPSLRTNPLWYVSPRIINGKERWANQTDSGQNRLGPSPTRAEVRSKTYPGIAKAMSMQWSEL